MSYSQSLREEPNVCAMLTRPRSLTCGEGTISVLGLIAHISLNCISGLNGVFIVMRVHEMITLVAEIFSVSTLTVLYKNISLLSFLSTTVVLQYQSL